MKIFISKMPLETGWDGGGMSKFEWELSDFLAKRGIMINKPGNGNHSDLRKRVLFVPLSEQVTVISYI